MTALVNVVKLAELSPEERNGMNRNPAALSRAGGVLDHSRFFEVYFRYQ
jgi:hypothetical protein